MRRWPAFMIQVLLPVFMLVGVAAGDWASVQSPRAVISEPNDFWYWHRINADVTVWDLDPTTDISYDEDHTYFWHWGPNYLNMPRAWGILLRAAPAPVGILSTDTEFLLDHWDMRDNVLVNGTEYMGRSGVDDDNNGLIDDIRDFRLGSDNYVTMVNQSALASNHASTSGSIEQHGTNMIAQAVARTNNENWWVGRDPSDYLSEVPDRLCGVPGLLWNRGKLVASAGSPYAHEHAVEYATWLNRKGARVRVASCSWINHTAAWAKRLDGYGILLVTGSSNTNWEVNPGADNQPCLVMGGVEKSYRRARISGNEDGSCYRVNDSYPDAAIDANGYWNYGGGLFVWNSDPLLWGYRGLSIASSQIGGLTLGYYISTGLEGTQSDYEQTIVAGFPGVGDGITQGTTSSPQLSQSLMSTDFRTSGATTQGASVAALIFALYPDLIPEQVIGMVRRGCVTVDPQNTSTCCLDEDKENCFTWVDGSNGYPLDGVMQDGGFSDDGEITGRIEGDDCAGLLGAGRLDAYRTMTLWGLIDRDTTLSGDIYVSGDVVISNADVTIAPGTRFFIAPDDITYLDPWQPEIRYDMSDATDDGIGYFEDFPTEPYASIEFVIYDDTASLIFLSTPENPAIFDSFVDGPRGASDWIGINDRAVTRIFTPNGAGSYEVLHSTLGVH